MRIECSKTGLQFRFYDDSKKKPKRIGIVEVAVHGPRAVLRSLDSELFYENFDMIWDCINLNCNTKIWHAHMMESHLRLALMKLKTRYKLVVLANEKNCDRDMVWVEVTKR